MIRPFARPSRMKDALGIAVLSGTAWLYTLALPPAPGEPPCTSCAELPAPASVPLEPQPAGEAPAAPVSPRPAPKSERRLVRILILDSGGVSSLPSDGLGGRDAEEGPSARSGSVFE
jgi:hypothetical protein